ncbi:DedA family protein [Halorussus salinus]|uniref:DedA family protein n=1 Tax=Halorussus salinus TaxID=1364935 RepID=UPI001091BAF9|nr:VTT domain-containing protein [Halorussus salinus]
MFEHLGETALRLVEQYGYLALAVFTFLEASMLFPLLPSEVVVPGAAALLVAGPVTFALFAAAVVVGTTVGSLFAYHVFGERGRSALSSRGGSLRVSEERIERATGWFRRWGEHSVLWGRLLPVLRSVVSIPAGLAGMARWKFTLYSAVGALAFAAVVAAAVETGLNLLGLG